MKQLFLLAIGLLLRDAAIAQAGVGPGAYCMPDYWNKPCNQPNASNNTNNYVNDFIDAFNTSGGVTNINNSNTGCQTQMIAGTQHNYFSYGCPTHLRANPGAVITCNFLSGIIFGQGFVVYVDWNRDCVFSSSERACATPNVPSAATWASSNFTIPAGTPNGAYRMRVRCVYATPGTSIDPCTQESYGETHDYTLYIGSNCDGSLPVCSALPITLMAFSAEKQKDRVAIRWSTATEYKNNHFVIERSSDGENFSGFEKVNGAGTSNSFRNYTVYDEHFFEPFSYYRLKQFDDDGTMWKSEVIVVETGYRRDHLLISPNPATDEIRITLPDNISGQMKLTVRGSSGRVVISSAHGGNEGAGRILLSVAALKKGFYTLEVQSEDGTVLRGKFIRD